MTKADMSDAHDAWIRVDAPSAHVAARELLACRAEWSERSDDLATSAPFVILCNGSYRSGTRNNGSRCNSRRKSGRTS